MDEKLKKGEITLSQVYQISFDYYKKFKNTSLRKLPYIIKNMQATANGDLKYDKEKDQWDGLDKSILLKFLVQAKELTSAKVKTTVNEVVSEYPVTFRIADVSLGLDSTFKWRSGADLKPVFQMSGASLQEKEKVTFTNRQNKVYLPFFFELEGVLPLYDLLEGKNHTNTPPSRTNPKLVPYFDKLAAFCFETGVVNLFNNRVMLAKLLGKV